MAANNVAVASAAREHAEAFLLRGDTPSAEDKNLSALLDCVGVHWQVVSAAELKELRDGHARGAANPYYVLTSASALSAALNHDTNAAGKLPEWIARPEGVYVYGFQDDSGSNCLLRSLTGDLGASVRSVASHQTAVTVTRDFPQMCGPMSGLHFQARLPEKSTVFDLPARSTAVQDIIATDQGPVLVSVKRGDARLFLNSAPQILDVTAPCSKYIDIRETFADTVPIIMFLRFALGAFPSSGISASLIVDDPLLKPRYGFMKYTEILRMMDEHNFSTTLAFIPWNWRRTDSKTVQLFQRRPDKLSLCVHGCDHTAREFAERSRSILNKRVKVANQRMQLLRRRTKLAYDPVMLFPQGAFAASAAHALKVNGFTAIANTEVSPVHQDENKTTVGDMLGLAIMKYSSFPLFTRRYLAHGVENFAFDGLLGKPCLIATHHDDFANDSRVLLQVIAQLNALHWKLRWRPLGETIRDAYTRRTSKDGSSQVEMYGSTLVYENSRESAERTILRKLESDPDRVNVVMVNGQPVDYVHKNGYLRIEAAVPPKGRMEVRIVYSDDKNLASRAGSWKYQATAIARRYLSEFRDNYLSRNTQLLQRALKVKQALGL